MKCCWSKSKLIEYAAALRKTATTPTLSTLNAWAPTRSLA
ncbi:hypothetical protein HMPREF0299_7309 [Corynebacterium matruchotii ATCC 14266]|uniref:Uncharacterized protein n=1 Tax=Corynebacterium matruchotii ATCC 14266 TaxID=553207 RepID=E0DEB4_9CORY|nr:hypothetical protein HMPREF0299_7309 [Corynebacterium matruchotii ATCC 14266]